MPIRTKEQVDALWPKNKSQYVIRGAVTCLATTKTQAIAAIQKLYEGAEAAAGMFTVDSIHQRHTPKRTTFLVSFIRDVPDDIEVVDDQLIAGKNFHKVLVSQLRLEIRNSIKERKLNMKVVLASLVTFKK